MTQSFVPRHRWVLVRNPKFHQWSSQAQPGGYPSRIILRLDIPPGPAVNAVEQNRADVLLSPPPARIHQLATRYPSQLHSGPLGATIGLVLNTRVWPFDVLAARQALNYAIDRATLIRLIGGPLMAQPTCQILPPPRPATSRTARTRSTPAQAAAGRRPTWPGRNSLSPPPAPAAPK